MSFAFPAANKTENDSSNSSAPTDAQDQESNIAATQVIEDEREDEHEDKKEPSQTNAAHTSDIKEPRFFVADPRGYVAVVHEIAAPFEATRVSLNATVKRVFWKTGRVEVLPDLSSCALDHCFCATIFQCS